MTSHEFVAGLVAEMQSVFARLGAREALEAESRGQVEIVPLLKAALQSEVEAAELRRKVLERLCTTPELQRLAAQAARNTLAIADELSTLAERSTGMHSIPVS